MGALSGKRVALAETRELDLLADMLTREGADVFRCPLIAILDAPDATPIEAWLKRFIAGSCDDLILYTGEGVRRLTGFAERAGFKDQFVAALRWVRKITRGPKPVKALRAVGLEPDLIAEAPTTAGIIATLGRLDLKSRRVGVQLYGQEPNAELMAFLERQGAQVDTVAPYIYATEADEGRVQALLDEMNSGRVAALVFTSSAQIERLFEVAKKSGREAKAILAKTRVAAVGPVVAATLAAHGITADAMPESTFSLKPLVRAVIAAVA